VGGGGGEQGRPGGVGRLSQQTNFTFCFPFEFSIILRCPYQYGFRVQKKRVQIEVSKCKKIKSHTLCRLS
jgi:hypothetical protein